MKNTIYLMVMVVLLTSCATMPKKLSTMPTLPKEFSDVGYKENYWSFFQEIVIFSVYKNKIIFLNEDVDTTILYKDIISIEYGKPSFTDPNNTITIVYHEQNKTKKAYFTYFKYLGWVAGTSEIYQALIYAYENQPSQKAIDTHKHGPVNKSPLS